MSKIQYSDIFDFNSLKTQLDSITKELKDFSAGADAMLSTIATRQKQVNDELAKTKVILGGANTGTSGAEMKALTDKITELINTLSTLSTTQRKVRTTTELVQGSIKDLEAQVKKTDNELKSMNEQERNAAIAAGNHARAVEQAARVINDYKAKINEAKRAMEFATGSYKELEQRNGELKKRLRETAGALDQATGKWNTANASVKRMVDEIQKNDAALKRLDATIGNHQRNVGNYGGALDGTILSAGGLKSQLIGLGAAYLSLDAIISGVRGFIDTNIQIARYEAGIKGATSSSTEFEKSLTFLRETASKYGLDIISLGNGYKVLAGATKNTYLEGERTRKIFLGIAASAAAMQLSTEDTEGALRAFGQMLSKNTVQMEELKGQLGDRLPGVLKIAADSLGMTTQALTKQIEQAKILSKDLVPALADALFKLNEEAAKDNVNNLAGSMTKLTTETKLLVAEFGKTSGVNDFFKTIMNGISNTLTAMRKAIKDDGWVGFFRGILDMGISKVGLNMLPGGGMLSALNGNYLNNKMDESVVSSKSSDFAQMGVNQRLETLRKQYLLIEQLEKKLADGRNTIVGGNKDEIERSLKVAKKLYEEYQKIGMPLQLTTNQLKDVQKITEQINKLKQEDRAKEYARYEAANKRYKTELEQSDKLSKNHKKVLETRLLMSEVVLQGIKTGADPKKPKTPSTAKADRAATRIVEEELETKLLKLQIEREQKLISEEDYVNAVYGTKVEYFNKLAEMQKGEVEQQNYLNMALQAELEVRKEINKLRSEDAKDAEDAAKDAQKAADDLKKQMDDERKKEIDSIKAEMDSLVKNFERMGSEGTMSDAMAAQMIYDTKVAYYKLIMEYLPDETEKEEYQNEIIKERIKLQKFLNALKGKNDKPDKEFDPLTSNEKLIASLELSRYALQEMNNVVQAYADNRLNIMRQMYDKEIELAGNNEDAKKKIEKRADQEERKIKRQMAIREKLMAVLIAGLNLAIAISTPGPMRPFNIASASIGLATAIATPIPKFARGKKKGDSYEGLGLVGEAGAEIVERRGDKKLVTGPTVMELDRETVVYTAKETDKLLRDEKIHWANRSLHGTMMDEMYSKRIDQNNKASYVNKILVGKEVERAIMSGFDKVSAVYLDEQGHLVRRTKNLVVKEMTKRSDFL